MRSKNNTSLIIIITKIIKISYYVTYN